MNYIEIDTQIKKGKPENKATGSIPDFTDVEKKMIEFIGKGYSNKELTKELLLSPYKIKRILADLLVKTNTRNLAHLMLFVAMNNVIDY